MDSVPVYYDYDDQDYDYDYEEDFDLTDYAVLVYALFYRASLSVSQHTGSLNYNFSYNPDEISKH